MRITKRFELFQNGWGSWIRKRYTPHRKHHISHILTTKHTKYAVPVVWYTIRYTKSKPRKKTLFRLKKCQYYSIFNLRLRRHSAVFFINSLYHDMQYFTSIYVKKFRRFAKLTLQCQNHLIDHLDRGQARSAFVRFHDVILPVHAVVVVHVRFPLCTGHFLDRVEIRGTATEHNPESFVTSPFMHTVNAISLHCPFLLFGALSAPPLHYILYIILM